jgi:signal peptidase I
LPLLNFAALKSAFSASSFNRARKSIFTLFTTSYRMNRKETVIDSETPTDSSSPKHVEETPFEAIASICSVLVVGLFILTFIGQNFVIPSGSMENTLLVGDHLLVDRINMAPPAKWMPLVHYREPKRGDILVFIKPVADEVNGEYQYLYLVKRCIGVPGDHLHLHEGTVYVNGKAYPLPPTGIEGPANPDDQVFLDEFPAIPPQPRPGATPEAWAIEFQHDVHDGDLVVPPGRYFMMGDNRHDSLDSRYWGFVPRQNIVGRPLFNYWSFKTPDGEYDQTGIGNKLAWMAHIVIRFIPDTRWSRTLKLIH